MNFLFGSHSRLQENLLAIFCHNHHQSSDGPHHLHTGGSTFQRWLCSDERVNFAWKGGNWRNRKVIFTEFLLNFCSNLNNCFYICDICAIYQLFILLYLPATFLYLGLRFSFTIYSVKMSNKRYLVKGWIQKIMWGDRSE